MFEQKNIISEYVRKEKIKSTSTIRHLILITKYFMDPPK